MHDWALLTPSLENAASVDRPDSHPTGDGMCVPSQILKLCLWGDGMGERMSGDFGLRSRFVFLGLHEFMLLSSLF